MSTYKLNSSDVQVFPSAYRSNGFNPEARLNSEFNLRNFTNSLTDFDGFVINYNESEKNKVITFNLLGYYFKLDLTTALSNYSNANGILCAGIKLLNFNNTITDDNKEFEGQTLSNLSRNTITGLDSGGTEEEPSVFSGIELFLDSDTYTNEDDEQKPQREKYTAYLKLLTLPSRVVPFASRFKFSGNSITTDNLNNITDCFTTKYIESGVDNDCYIDLGGLVEIYSASTFDIGSVDVMNISSGKDVGITSNTATVITSPVSHIKSPHISLGGGHTEHIFIDNAGSSQLMIGVEANKFDKITVGSPVQFDNISAKNITVSRTEPTNENTDGVITCYNLSASEAQINDGSIQTLDTQRFTNSNVEIYDGKLSFSADSYLTDTNWICKSLYCKSLSGTDINASKLHSRELSVSSTFSTDRALVDFSSDYVYIQGILRTSNKNGNMYPKTLSSENAKFGNFRLESFATDIAEKYLNQEELGVYLVLDSTFAKELHNLALVRNSSDGAVKAQMHSIRELPLTLVLRSSYNYTSLKNSNYTLYKNTYSFLRLHNLYSNKNFISPSIETYVTSTSGGLDYKHSFPINITRFSVGTTQDSLASISLLAKLDFSIPIKGIKEEFFTDFYDVDEDELTPYHLADYIEFDISGSRQLEWLWDLLTGLNLSINYGYIPNNLQYTPSF